MRGGEHHRCRVTVIVRPKPVDGGHAPAVAGRQAREAVFRRRALDRSLPIERWCVRNSAVTTAQMVCRPGVLGSGRAAAVAVETGQRFGAARVQRGAEHVRSATGQSCLTWCAVKRVAPQSMSAPEVTAADKVTCSGTRSSMTTTATMEVEPGGLDRRNVVTDDDLPRGDVVTLTDMGRETGVTVSRPRCTRTPTWSVSPRWRGDGVNEEPAADRGDRLRSRRAAGRSRRRSRPCPPSTGSGTSSSRTARPATRARTDV